jgi:hypothetical protein
MKQKLFYFAIIAVTITADACRKNSTPAPAKNVYVAGNFIDRAVYWKNDSLIYLGAAPSDAYAICISGNDVYIAGYEFGSSNNTLATYWKNGNPVHLTDGTYSAEATSIAISGNDVYVAGYQTPQSGHTEAVYWKNGVPVTLSPGSATIANGISVANDSVYVAGSYGGDAVYWANQKVFFLSDLTSYATDIKVSGSDIYVTGDAVASSSIQAFYWKNGVPTQLSTIGGLANSIAIAGNDIYVAGYEYIVDTPTDNSVATYWQNNIPHHLSDGTKPENATGIFVSGNDVYVSGFEGDGSLSIVKYWKNGVPVTLTQAQNRFAAAYAIAVQ